jgi:hypothetical protein
MPADDWLSAMLRNQYASPQGLAPGGGVMAYPAASGQGPNMGYPGAGMGAQQSPAGAPGGAVPNLPITPAIAAQLGGQPQQAPPLIQFGGFHPGNAVNPELFHDLAVTKAKLASLIGLGQPAAAAQPAQPDPRLGSSVTMGPSATIGQGQLLGGEQPSFPARAPSPYGTGIFPGAPGTPPEANFPEPTPTGTPSDTPRPSGALARYPPSPPKRPTTDSAAPSVPPTGRRAPGFTTVQYQPTNSARNQPTYTALDLSKLFGRG